MTDSKRTHPELAPAQADRPARDATPLPLEAAPAEAPGEMPRWVYLLALALLTAAGVALRAIWLRHPMRYDESWTFLFYVLPRKLSAALVYSAPNNHILHTVLVALASWLAGDGPVALRMPAFLAGVALIPAAGHLATVLSHRRLAGLVAAAFVACSSILVDYSVNARGYTLFCLSAVILAERTVRICRDARPAGPWICWIVIAALGLLNIPVMVYPMIVLAAVLLLGAFLGPGGRPARGLVLRRTVAVLVASAVLGFLLYLPVLRATGLVATEDDPAARASPIVVYGSGLYGMVANPIIGSRPFAEAAARLPGVTVEALAEWARDTSWPWWVLAGGGLVAAGAVGVRRRRAFYLLPLVVAVVLPGLALAQRIVPFARLWLFALPLLLAVSSCGLAELGYRIRPGWLRGAGAAAILLAVAAASMDPVWRLCQPDRRVLGECALVDARAIVTDALELADGQTGLAWDYELSSWAPLAYYEVILSRESRHFIPYLQDRCRRVLVVVPKVQSLQDVLEHRPRLAAAYGTVYLWRRYRSADVYLSLRGL
ncbi:MAG: hypothetical protein MUP47_04830 [Phycisphaerae bacterium]|nr:hypothetical protein [Phycisphaerae bacterium]